MIREREAANPAGSARCSSCSCWPSGSLLYAGHRDDARRRDRASSITAALADRSSRCFLLVGLFVVNPNEGRVLQLFGDYVGTVKTRGPALGQPVLHEEANLAARAQLREHTLKVNDIEGNPIEIAAVVVWRVVDTAEAVFEVDDYQNFVKVQTEAAVRNLATSYKYDAHEEDQMSLRGNTAAVAEHMKREIQDRLAKAGVEVLEARISHLAYAPEIAQAMLQRQQAGAIIAARQRIVEGAVGMVRDGARHAVAARDPRARQRAQGGDGQQPARGAVRRALDAAGHQHGHDLSVARRG